MTRDSSEQSPEFEAPPPEHVAGPDAVSPADIDLGSEWELPAPPEAGAHRGGVSDSTVSGDSARPQVHSDPIFEALAWAAPSHPEQGEDPFALEGQDFPALATFPTIGGLNSVDAARRRSDPAAIEPRDAPSGTEPEPAATPLSWILLVSYASAVTLALLWVVLGDRSLRQRGESLGPPPEPVPSLCDPSEGQRSDLTRDLGPALPIGEGNHVALGETIQVGDLEITPTDIVRDAVVLEHLGGDAETKDGGRDALWLRLKLRNRSETTSFAPLDESFIRDPDRGAPNSFVECGDASGTRIYHYPLAVLSEWGIRGQGFPALHPGEAGEVVVLSTPGIGELGASPYLWRVQLRTAGNRTDLIGVRFRGEQVVRR